MWASRLVAVLLLGAAGVGCVLSKSLEIFVHPEDVRGEATPIVMWHGMGDSCCDPLSMGSIERVLMAQLPGVYIKSLEMGDGQMEDRKNSFLMPANEQVRLACRMIGLDPRLADGYNAIGFSQGGQFLRAVAQRCPQGMKKLISFGGQHQGIYGLPYCFGEDHTYCDYARTLLNHFAYVSWVQNHLVQAQYWHDPLKEELYREKSVFLADINNERRIKNQTYKENLSQLEKLVLVSFTEDSMVDPRATEWFGFYAPGQSTIILPYNETSLYKEDWIGLRQLDEAGKLDFLSIQGGHLAISVDILKEIANDYLKK